jgi:hypothetical protein
VTFCARVRCATLTRWRAVHEVMVGASLGDGFSFRSRRPRRT